MPLLTPLTQEEIAARAREIWRECGCPTDRDVDFWLRAERELELERRQAEKFRAGL